MPKFHNVDQRSDEWLDLRAGKITGSQLTKIMSGTSTQGFKDTINRIASERALGETIRDNNFVSYDMQKGIDLEPVAIDVFEKETLISVKDGGFWEYSETIGDSPDGNFNGGTLEVKVVKYNTIEKYHLSGKMPNDYKWQCQHHLLCSGTDKGFFMAYNELYKPFILEYGVDNDLKDQMLERFDLCEKLISDRIDLISEFIK